MSARRGRAAWWFKRVATRPSAWLGLLSAVPLCATQWCAAPLSARRGAHVAWVKQRLHRLLAQGQAQGELRADLDVQAAATLFIGTVQGLVMQSLISGDMARMCGDAPRVFVIYQRGIGAAESTP